MRCRIDRRIEEAAGDAVAASEAYARSLALRPSTVVDKRQRELAARRVVVSPLAGPFATLDVACSAERPPAGRPEGARLGWGMGRWIVAGVLLFSLGCEGAAWAQRMVLVEPEPQPKPLWPPPPPPSEAALKEMKRASLRRDVASGLVITGVGGVLAAGAVVGAVLVARLQCDAYPDAVDHISCGIEQVFGGVGAVALGAGALTLIVAGLANANEAHSELTHLDVVPLRGGAAASLRWRF